MIVQFSIRDRFVWILKAVVVLSKFLCFCRIQRFA